MIMLHGFRGTHHGFGLIAENLKDYNLIIPDIPGFGESKELDDKHNIDNYVKWLHDFISSLKLDQKPILIGHSFGSIVASYYAAKYPQTITKLILINPIGAPALSGPRAIASRITQFYYWVGKNLPDKAAVKWLGSKTIVMAMSVTMAKTRDKKLRKYIHSEHLQHFSTFASKRVIAESFDTSIRHSVKDVAGDLKIPTMMIVADKDDITSLKQQEKLSKIVPDNQMKIINNVGHLTHYETPEIVAQYIKEFIVD